MMLRRQLVVVSGVIHYQRVEQQTDGLSNRSGEVFHSEPLQRITLEVSHDKPGDG